MATITKSEQSLVPHIGLVVGTALLSRLSQDELSDRAHYVAELQAKAAAAGEPVLKQAYGRLAGAVLQEPMPRDEVLKHVGDMNTKADLMPDGPPARQLRAAAETYLDEHPVAPKRQQRVRAMLRKAADAGQVAVYDADGNLVGTCDPQKITRLVPAKAPDAAPPAPAPPPAPAEDAVNKAAARQIIMIQKNSRRR